MPAPWCVAETCVSTIAQQLGEDDSIVVLPVASGVQNRQRPFPSPAPQPRKPVALGVQLVAVARAKLIETLRNMIEPAAQLVAGSQIARPFVQARVLARDPARPDMVDQHAVAVVPSWRVVNAFHPHRHLAQSPPSVTTRPQR